MQTLTNDYMTTYRISTQSYEVELVNLIEDNNYQLVVRVVTDPTIIEEVVKIMEDALEDVKRVSNQVKEG